MRKLLIISVITFSFSCVSAADHKAPIDPGSGAISVEQILKLTPREYEKMTGKKLKLKQKIALKIYQWKLKKHFKSADPATQKRQGVLSLIFGGLAVVATMIALIALLPGVFLFSAAFAIPGLILGIKSVEGNNVNTPGLLGIIFSSLVFLIFAIGIVAILTSGVE